MYMVFLLGLGAGIHLELDSSKRPPDFFPGIFHLSFILLDKGEILKVTQCQGCTSSINQFGMRNHASISLESTPVRRPVISILCLLYFIQTMHQDLHLCGCFPIHHKIRTICFLPQIKGHCCHLRKVFRRNSTPVCAVIYIHFLSIIVIQSFYCRIQDFHINSLVLRQSVSYSLKASLPSFILVAIHIPCIFQNVQKDQIVCFSTIRTGESDLVTIIRIGPYNILCLIITAAAFYSLGDPILNGCILRKRYLAVCVIGIIFTNLSISIHIIQNTIFIGRTISCKWKNLCVTLISVASFCIGSGHFLSIAPLICYDVITFTAKGKF